MIALFDWFDGAPLADAAAFALALLMGGAAFVLFCAARMAGRNHDPD